MFPIESMQSQERNSVVQTLIFMIFKAHTKASEAPEKKAELI